MKITYYNRFRRRILQILNNSLLKNSVIPKNAFKKKKRSTFIEQNRTESLHNKYSSLPNFNFFFFLLAHNLIFYFGRNRIYFLKLKSYSLLEKDRQRRSLKIAFNQRTTRNFLTKYFFNYGSFFFFFLIIVTHTKRIQSGIKVDCRLVE